MTNNSNDDFDENLTVRYDTPFWPTASSRLKQNVDIVFVSLALQSVDFDDYV